MVKFLAVLMVFCTLLTATGCGTTMNVVSDQPLPYGGAICDVTVGAQWVGEGLGICEPQSWFGEPLTVASRVALICGACLDFPLSLLGDTVTFPYALYRFLF